MTIGPYEIRLATPHDVEVIAQFQTDCWREAYRGLVPQDYLDRVAATERAHRWRHRLVSGERQAAVGWLGTAVVGVVSWSDRGAPPRELASLYVGAAHRGTGLAQALLELALGSGPGQLWVFAGNVRAAAFYARLGFTADGTTAIDPDTGLVELHLRRDAPG